MFHLFQRRKTEEVTGWNCFSTSRRVGHEKAGGEPGTGPGKCGVYLEWSLDKEQVSQPQMHTKMSRVPAFRLHSRAEARRARSGPIAALMSLRFPTPNAGGARALYPAGTAPYPLPSPSRYTP